MQETSSNPVHPQQEPPKHWFKQVSALSGPLISAQLLSKMLNFLAFFLLTRALGLQNFGIWIWAFSLVALLASCWSFGLQVWLSKASARAANHLAYLIDTFTKAISIRFLALLLVVSGGIVWLLVIGPPDNLQVAPQVIQKTLLGLLVGFAFRSTGELFGAMMRGHLLTWPDGVALFTARLFFVLFLVWGDANQSLSLTWVAFFFALSEACATLLLSTFFLRHFKQIAKRPQASPAPTPHRWGQFLKELSMYGLMLMASAFLFRVGMLFSGHSLDAEQVGIFAVLHRLNEFSLFFPEAMAAVLLPFWTRGNAQTSSQQMSRMVLVMVMAGLLMGTAAYGLAPFVLPHMFPAEAQNVLPWLWVLIPLFALQFSNQTLLAHMMSQNQELKALRLLGLAGAVAIGGMTWFAQDSLLHLVWAILAAEAFFTVGALLSKTDSHVSN